MILLNVMNGQRFCDLAQAEILVVEEVPLDIRAHLITGGCSPGAEAKLNQSS
jgi:hypothetical protein